MKQLAWLLKWILKAAIFFTLFAFALNNQHDATVHLLFGSQWRTPLVIVVLAAFAAGVAVGIVAMMPQWWKDRAKGRRNSNDTPSPDSLHNSSSLTTQEHGL